MKDIENVLFCFTYFKSLNPSLYFLSTINQTNTDKLKAAIRLDKQVKGSVISRELGRDTTRKRQAEKQTRIYKA